jgi:hypothetical protein
MTPSLSPLAARRSPLERVPLDFHQRMEVQAQEM